MAMYETLIFPFGKAKRRQAPIRSPTLLVLPETSRPPNILACATCPAGKWYHLDGELACHCVARRYVSWKPKQKAIVLCDDREDALAEQEADQTS